VAELPQKFEIMAQVFCQVTIVELNGYTWLTSVSAWCLEIAGEMASGEFDRRLRAFIRKGQQAQGWVNDAVTEGINVVVASHGNEAVRAMT